MIYAAIISLILAVVYCHERDWKESRATGRVNHSKALVWKILACIPAGFFFTITLTGWPFWFSWFTVLASGKSILLTGTWFLFLFNGYWGWRVEKSWFYRSKAVGANISKWDKMVLHWPKGLYILFVLALITGATLIYFLWN